MKNSIIIWSECFVFEKKNESIHFRIYLNWSLIDITSFVLAIHFVLGHCNVATNRNRWVKGLSVCRWLQMQVSLFIKRSGKQLQNIKQNHK